MKIVPERVTVLPDLQSGELTVIMEGYRLTFSPEEARVLSYALLQGTKHLHPEAPRPPAVAHTVAATATFPAKPAAAPASPDATRAMSDDVAKEVIRSLSA
jgi:hypothetical protein